ncbi:uncharacterized protein DSM5745_03705 [Aspergillus mulundensis]|uniref:Serine hydrolase domain-containing protein n=1 Tax=Aspergillus mulundensis TaxID=1810919 RepID=A0A3D8SL76_9EURO|nr:Uncharacterized protein DSM5745_03705 [Aspergillus mulundensis]RDW87063.1 Uncharacterized protein DSM5745_03705 [Aspergillus mulundensis]
MPSIIETPRTFRILMLHARLLTEQITSSLLPTILPSYPDGIEFIFPDAPFVFGSETTEPSDLESRAWWLNLDDVSRYVGLEGTLVRLSESLDRRPIHAAVGFSQGGALAAMVTGLCDASTNPRRRSALAAQGLPVDAFLQNLPGQEPLKFVVCISGFRGTMKYYSGFYESSLSTPSLHVIAELDTMIADIKSRELVSVFVSPQVMYHGGGHYIPRDRALLRRVGEFVQQAYSEETRKGCPEAVCQPVLTKAKQAPVGQASKQQFMRRRVTSICTFAVRPGF